MAQRASFELFEGETLDHYLRAYFNGLTDVVVYITSEVTLHPDLYFYSGGLGEITGSVARASYQLGLPVIGVSLLYREGYGEQGVGAHGMTSYYVRREYDRVLRKTERQCVIMIDGQPVYADIWECPAGTFGNMPFYFLDTDIPMNNDYGRINTKQLYGGSEQTGRNKNRMICQAITLGVGAVEAPRALGYNAVAYHMNESHSVMAPLYLLALALRAGTPLEEALDAVRRHVVFTNHTPIDDGNPKYDVDTILKLARFPKISKELMNRLGGHSLFDSTVACLRLSRDVNAVSRRHLDVCRDTWGNVTESGQWHAITNGVTPGFWQSPAFAEADTIEKIEAAKKSAKRDMLFYVEGRTDKQFDENRLTIGWFRRFAKYKRPKLIFRDMQWLRAHLEAGDFQLVIGGKPHPDDEQMIDAWNEIYHLSYELPNIAILYGYDPRMSKIVKSGCDLWMMSSRAPFEACITSTLSAPLVGANIMSIPDGWAHEALSASNSIFFYGTSVPTGMFEQDGYDAQQLREVIDQRVIPEFQDKQAWFERQLRIRRMVLKDYTDVCMMQKYWKFYGVDAISQ